MATDVAARGLDMIVDLVLNAEPPTHQSGRVDTESYVHRSGRTGRAGRKGMCITLYTPRQRGGLGEIGEGRFRVLCVAGRGEVRRGRSFRQSCAHGMGVIENTNRSWRRVLRVYDSFVS